jgi:copper chaperone NosL
VIKRTAVGMIFLMLLLCIGGTAAFAGDDIDAHRSCAFCGMDRKAYGFSRMLIQYEDGTTVGVCSLHCAVIELDADKGRVVKALLVADRDTRTLIDVDNAVWVMGGSKRGVMTQRPKWAFRSQAAAKAFLQTYGGTIITWTEALAAAWEDLAQEVR